MSEAAREAMLPHATGRDPNCPLCQKMSEIETRREKPSEDLPDEDF